MLRRAFLATALTATTGTLAGCIGGEQVETVVEDEYVSFDGEFQFEAAAGSTLVVEMEIMQATEATVAVVHDDSGSVLLEETIDDEGSWETTTEEDGTHTATVEADGSVELTIQVG